MNYQDPKDAVKRSYQIKCKAVNSFISRYKNVNGKEPSEELLRQFFNFRHYEYPLPSEEEYVENMYNVGNSNINNNLTC